MSKSVKYLVFLIIGLLIIYFASSIYIYLLYLPYTAHTGLTFEDYYNAIQALNNYFDKHIIEEIGITWNEFATQLFQDKVLFENTTLLFCILQFLSYIPLLLLIFYFLRKELKEDLILFKKNIKRNLVIIGITFASMILLSNIVSLIYDSLKIKGDSNNENLITLLLNSKGSILMILSVVFMAPLCEEIIYRKLLIGTCEETFKLRPIIAIVISTVVFSIIHVSDSLESLKFIFQYIALALPMCLAYHYSGNNIYVTIIVHFINNALSVIGTLLLS